MHKKKLFLGVSIAALAVSAASFAAVVASKREMLVKATPQTDYQQTLTFTAENMSAGSGSVTLNGNTFNYSGVVISGNNLVFGAGSSLEFASESGATKSASGMVGGSFKTFAFQSIGACSVTYTFSGESDLVFEATDGELFAQSINSPTFALSITAGSFTTEAFHIEYDCVAPVQSHNVLIVGSTDVCNVTDSSAHPNIWVADAYTEIMSGLGNTATYTFQSIPTHTLAVIADATTTGGKRLRNALNAAEYDAVVIQIPRRCTPSGTDVEASEIAALASLKTLLHSETDNIFMLAPWTEANPTIFQVGESGNDLITYVSTGNKETKTLQEMAAYYADLAYTMATTVEGKVMNLAQPFASYAAKHSFKNASKHLLFGYVMYCSFFNRMVPAACTYTDGNSTAAVNYIREETQAFCVHPEVL